MDKILQMFFEFDRWEAAIAKGIIKDVPKAALYQLCKPEVRTRMYEAIRDGRYEIAPPHTAKIPKDTPGEFRTVYVNEAVDRVLLSIANDLLFELMPDKVHPSCKSYLKGVGCGRVVQEASAAICRLGTEKGKVIGFKSDLSKYFDSVPIGYIDAAFDMVELRHGRSALIDVLRKYYHSDWYFDTEGHLLRQYQSLKQGCSVASWLADVLLYHIDGKLSSMNGYYVRYSDDMLYIGDDYDAAMDVLRTELGKMEMRLNPKKVELLDAAHWFKFLGFSIRGRDISMSSSRIKKFQKEIESRTIRALTVGRDGRSHLVSFAKALNSVNRYLYHGDGQGHSWATGILGVVNVRQDVDTMNTFVMDCLRAVDTGKTKVGGLGYDRQGKVGCIVRGRGRNVSANRRKTGDDISGYMSLGCMQNAIRTSRAAYDTLVRSLSAPAIPPESGGTKRGLNKGVSEAELAGVQTTVEDLETAYAVYKHSIPSERTMNRTHRFYALPESELSDDDMLYGRDMENFEARNRWFNRELCIAMAADYIAQMRKDAQGRPTHSCKGVPYIKFSRQNVFVSDIEKKLVWPMLELQHAIERVSSNPQKLYEAVRDFRRAMYSGSGPYKQCARWKDAYKGAGAYFTMQNLLRFHGAKFPKDNDFYERGKSGLEMLDAAAELYWDEGWRLFGLMKQMIEENGIDIKAKMKQWAKAKEAKNLNR